MEARSRLSGWWAKGGWVVVLIAVLQLGLHLWTNLRDGIFRDELYYLAAADHLDFGYVEFPPFTALVAALSRAIFGGTVFGLRLLSALAGATTILLTAGMVATLGGGPAAQTLAALAVGLGPTFLGASGLLGMDPFDQLWWTLAALLLMRLIRDEQPRRWLGLGVVVGVGLLTKLPIAFFTMMLLIGLVVNGQRKLVFNRRALYGGLIAGAIALPYFVWQALHGFPLLEFTGAYSSGKTFQASPIEFIAQQVLTLNPFSLPLWLGGLYFLFFAAKGKPYRAFGWAYVLLLLFFMALRAKFYWLTPAYPPLFAAGAVGLEQLVQARPRLGWMRPASYAVLLGLTGLLLVPFALPILPPERFASYNAAFGGTGTEAARQENLQASELPQNYADRYGWQEMVAAVDEAYESLTPEEKAKACILTVNYGEAGAIDRFGPALGLPRAISGHNSYYFWGPQGCTGEVVITLARPRSDLVDSFESVEAGPSWSCKYCMPYENGAPIFIARGLKFPMEDAWPTTRDFN